MNADREAALRGLLEAIRDILNVPPPAHHDDDDLYLCACAARIGTVEVTVKVLISGVLDNVAVQEAGRVLRGVAGDLPVTYPVAS